MNSKIIKSIYLVTLLLVCVSIISLTLQFIAFTGYNEQTVEAFLLSKNDTLVTSISGVLNQNAQIIQGLTSLVEANTEVSLLLTYMKKEMEKSLFSSLYYGTVNNEMINGSGWIPPEDFDLRTRPWYQMAMENRTLVFTNAFMNASKDMYIITIANPVYSQNGSLVGVVGGDVALKSIFTLINDHKISENGYSFMFDDEGGLLSHPLYNQVSFDSVQFASDLMKDYKLHFENNGFSEIQLEGIDGYVAIQSIPSTNWKIGSFVPKVDFSLYQKEILVFFSTTLVLSLLVIGFLFAQQKKLIIDPLKRIGEDIALISLEDNVAYRLPSRTNDSFYDVRMILNRVLDQMEIYLNQLNGEHVSLLEKNQKIEQMMLALNESELEYRTLANSGKALIWKTDSLHQLVWVNDVYIRFTGLTFNNVINEGWNNIVHPDDFEHRKIIMKNAFENKLPFSIVYRLMNHIGEYHWIQDDGCPNYDIYGNFNGFIGFCLDIHEQKMIELDLLNEKKVSEMAMKAQSQFLSNMSHEIRTPMNGIMGTIHLMGMTDLTLEQQELVKMAGNSLEALMIVINDILDYSKLEARQMRLEAKPFNVNSLVNEVVALFNFAAMKKGIKLVYNAALLKKGEVVGDVFRYRQIISNLIGNAIKFTNSGTVEITLEEVACNETHTRISFRIKDTGIGIAECDVDRIFDRFSQADNSNSRGYGGTGLGLAISRQLAELMDGDIAVESVLGEGSTFVFTCNFGIHL